jgi:hypothetical protein
MCDAVLNAEVFHHTLTNNMKISNDAMQIVISFCDGVSWHVHGVTVDKHEIYQDNWSQTEISVSHCESYKNESYCWELYVVNLQITFTPDYIFTPVAASALNPISASVKSKDIYFHHLSILLYSQHNYVHLGTDPLQYF